MNLDYWNHPLIVKAMRVKYRGGRLFTLATSYLVVLAAGGVIFYHYRGTMSAWEWARMYFICMVGLQFVLSSLMAISATSSSMHTEVISRTLDFQRIATISPLQILLGKAIGEPAGSYLLAAATVPIAVFCSVVGGISLIDVCVLYVTLATTTFLLACAGLQHTLDPASKAPQAGLLVGPLFFCIFISSAAPLRIGTRGGFLELIGAVIGLFTPISTIKGFTLDPAGIWSATMPFYGLSIPYAILTPLAQLALAALALLFMTRRLTEPLITPLSKLQSYGILLGLDGLWAAFQFDALRLGEGLAAPAVRFAAGHIVLTLLLAGRITPIRATFQSWAWRLRGKRGRFADLLYGERTPNPVALAVYCLIGVTVFTIAIGVPATVLDPGVLTRTDWYKSALALITGLLVIFMYGLFYQVAAITMGRGSAVAVFVAALILMISPWALGSVFNQPIVSSLSPIAVFIELQESVGQPYPPAPLVASYAFGIAFWTWSLLRVANRTVRQIDRRLQSMSVTVQPAITG